MAKVDARAVLLQKMYEALSPNSIEIYGLLGKEQFNFSLAASNIADILFAFYEKNGRMPEVIFNDGMPKVFEPLRNQPDFKDIVLWHRIYKQYGGPSGENQSISDAIFTSPFLAVKVMLAPTTVTVEDNINYETGSSMLFEEVISGPRNSKPENVDWRSVEFAAFQTWGVLIIAATNPEFLYATDEGIMLTRDGAKMVDRSLAYWLEDSLQPSGFGMFNQEITFTDFYTPGPVMMGVPFVIVDKLRQAIEASNRTRGHMKTFKFILSIVMSFVGFYFGASAMSGLVGGQFTIPNLTGTLNMAQKFGVDTGQLSTALKIVGLTTGNDPFNTASNLSKGASMDADFWSDIGINPDSISYDVSGMDFGGAGDFVAADYMSDPDFWNAIGIDPGSISYDLDGLDSSMVNDLISGDYGFAIEAFAQAPAYDDVAIRAENDAALAQSMGPMSATQYAAAAKASPSVATAAQAALKQAGASPNSVKATPAQASSAQQVAKQNATTAKLQGDTQSAGVWAAAGQLLKMYGDYQLADKKIEMATGPKLPATTMYPSNPGSVTRQPDGSISIRNADGSISTIRPNGQTAVTPAGSSLPSFLTDKKVLLAAGAGLAVVTVIALASRRR